MNVYSKWVGILAAIAWLMLAMLTAGSCLLERGTVAVNLVIATMFLGVAVFLIWRLRVMALVVQSVSANIAMKSLFRVEAVSASAMLLLGLILLAAAGSRVFGEGSPVFG